MNQNPRYDRHYILKDFGIDAQEKLGRASVLVIGAGGLGCPVLQYLTAAGIAKIGIADGDSVALSNLQRQVLFQTGDIGKNKAEIASEHLKKLNPEIEIVAHGVNIGNEEAIGLFADFDIIIDCTDNFASRYRINDACVLLDKPLIFGAIFRYEGQVAVFNVPDENALKTNYRDLFPNPPKANEVPDCNQAGVLGVLPGVIGTLMATETIKLITNLQPDLRNKIFTFDLRSYTNYLLRISENPTARELLPKSLETFSKTDYEWLCGMKNEGTSEILPENISSALNSNDVLAIDVREPDELPKPDFPYTNIPLTELKNDIPGIDPNEIIVFCQSGKRSLEATYLLHSHFGDTKQIRHLKGGMIAYQEFLHGKTN